jgi:cephalosporin-C deacetylase-like acetyl esterase
VGQLLGLRWSGGNFDADGKIELSGFTYKDLADSVKGTLHFEWRHGAVSSPGGAQGGGQEDALAAPTAALPATAPVPPALARFDRWTADAEIADGTITLKQNQVQQGSRKRAVEATLTLGDPPKVTFAAPGETQAKKR